MTWLAWLIIGGAAVAVLVLKRLALVRPDVARDWLRQGAIVIDVRSEREFQQDHLPGAINIPYERLRDELPQHAADKDQAILLHCLSGGRSQIAKGTARNMGYRHAFNLGSYRRAKKIVAS